MTSWLVFVYGTALVFYVAFIVEKMNIIIKLLEGIK